MYRSTKGASKARRDQINAEIRNLKELLPISDSDKSRLSYLHIMSLACMYTRKSVFFSEDPSEASHHEGSGTLLSMPEISELVHTLPGFLVVLTSEGKLLYLSDNVAEHLGHSMVDLVAQSDSVYDIIDPTDHFTMRSNLVPVTTPETERLFRCRFNTSKFVRRQGSGNKVTLVRARCVPSPFHASSYWMSNPVWVCFCSPLEQAPQSSTTRNPLPTPPAEQAFLLACFQSQHSRDMRVEAAQDCVSVYLGYDVDTLRSRSWYSLVHPRDLSHASAQHCTLLREGGERQVEMVVQVEAADHSWVWLYMVLQLQNGEHPIACQNYVISESEAWSVRQQLCSEQNQLSLLYQEGMVQQCSEPSLSSPEQVFTPSSSGLSTQSFDFSFAASGRSSSEELPSGTASLPMGSAPCPTFPLEDDSFSQQLERHQMWLPDTTKFSTTPSATVPPSQPQSHMSSLAGLSHTVGNSQAPVPPVHPPHIHNLPKRASMGELVCTPPYTPRFGGGRFMFGEELFKPDSTASAVMSSSSQITQTMQSASHPASLSTGTGLALSVQHCRRRLYEKQPLTPDSPDTDKCILMALPEIRGPLYVDLPHAVHHGPPEGLLTPEASPTEHPCQAFFNQTIDNEQEQLEISLLAQYLSSVAEGFCQDCPPATRTPSPVLPQQPLLTQNHIEVASSSSCIKTPPTMCWRDTHSPQVQDKSSLFEERLLPVVPSSSTSSTSSPNPSSPPAHPPPAPVSICSPGHPQEEALVGVHHLCSVQLTHRNSVTGGRLLEPELTNEGEAFTESEMDMELLPPELTAAVSASPESTTGPALPDFTPGLACAQSLLEELVNMEPVFEATAPITPALRQQPELYQLPLQESPQHFYQGENHRIVSS
ncbi:neuronal PAS domain-containing protein 4B isoform X1 [Astyanax mexicanus]|uniref:neuronal PAS domain-containing protein 4B isoform X1 n=1 Tax=Astyanax mexicanus TaxID=7994 RepID=UPI0020CB4329|nr:neuronal PAS domain-containing protein 4B isoform X1 [Astyanax mexicanus]